MNTIISSIIYIRTCATAMKIPPTTPAVFWRACTFAPPVKRVVPLVVELKPCTFIVEEGVSVVNISLGSMGDEPSVCPGVGGGVSRREGLFGLLGSEVMVGYKGIDGFDGSLEVAGSEEVMVLEGSSLFDGSLGVVGSVVVLDG